MSKFLKGILCVVALIGCTLCLHAKKGDAVTLKVFLPGGTTELQSSKDLIKKYEKQNPNVKVEAIKAPNSSEMLSFYLQMIEAKSSDLDVITLDSSWAINLHSSLVDLSKYKEIDKATVEKYYPSIMKSYLIDNKVVALPWYSDIGLLYYRTDLLKKYNQPVPKTWSELTKSAFIIQQGERKAGNEDFVGFVWQGKAYEGLTCNAIEWIHNSNGGTIVNDKK
jgi:trehalose/maltose transport system substrate-binding protein